MADASEPAGKKQKPQLFKPGQSGNPKGRPRGSRNVLGDEFIKDVLNIWKRRGKSCLEEMATDKPSEFVRVVAMVLPKDINVTGDIKHTHEETVSETHDWVKRTIGPDTETEKPLLN